MKKVILLFVAIFLFSCLSAYAPPGPVPERINYQGMLTESDGTTPLNGNYNLTFKIYNVASGGGALWTQVSNNVPVQNGLFTVELLAPPSIFNGPDRWLGITVGGDAELTPRVRLTSVAYAYWSLYGSGWVDDGSVVRLQTIGDKVGIGTASPAEKLHVAGDIRLNNGGDIAFGDDNTRIHEYSDDLYITADDDLYLGPDDDIYIYKEGVAVWVRFDNDNQRLGVGTTSPNEKLSVYGVLSLDETSAPSASSGWGKLYVKTDNKLYFKGDDNVEHDLITPIPAAGGWIDGGTTVRLQTSTDKVCIGASSALAKLHIEEPSTADLLRVRKSGSTKFIVKNNGNVGIGDLSPDEKLSVAGVIEIHPAGAAGTAIEVAGAEALWYNGSYFSWGYGGVSNYFADKVGIGTSSPAEKLHVAGDIRLNAGGDIAFGDDNTRIYEYSDDLYITADDDLYLRPDDDIYIGEDGGSYWVRFDNDSKELGVGTTSPSGRLHVEQSSYAQALNVKNTYSGGVGQTVNFERTKTHQSANDVLQIQITSGSSSTSQFIECQRGTNVKFKVNGNGSVYADGPYAGPADFSEMIAVSQGAFTAEPGDVMVIDPNNPRAISKASEQRSTLVAGIYSTKPGFVGSERDWDKPTVREDEEAGTYTLEDMASEFNEIPLAVVGIVPCKVSAENGSIRPGDLLVTSSTPGHAMRDDNPKVGTVLGKALGSLSSGTGVIKVLVTLH